MYLIDHVAELQFANRLIYAIKRIYMYTQIQFQDECRNAHKHGMEKYLLSLKLNIQVCQVFSDVRQKGQIIQSYIVLKEFESFLLSDMKDFISPLRDPKQENVAALLSQRT